MTIYFYAIHQPYGCFSNFSLHGFFLEGHYWKTVEHYYQAQKFFDSPFADVIRQAKTPKEAASFGKNRKFMIRENWDEIKDEVMRKGVLEKFKNNEDIREILLGTGDQTIIENSPYDYYWGCGQDGSGKNRLGEILMEVRESLR